MNIIGERRIYARSFNVEDEKKICQEYLSCKSLNQVAKKWDKTPTVIFRILKAYNIPTSKRKYHYDEHYFQNIDNELKAYFLGYLTTDGYIVEGPKRYVVTMTSTDPEIPQAFAKALGEGIPVYEIPPVNQRRNNIEYRVSACSKIMVQDIVSLGVRQAKSMKETFCNNIPVHLINHYMRGIFDGDGCIGFYDSQWYIPQFRFSIVGSNELLSEYAKQLHNHLDIPLNKPRKKSDNGLYVLNYGGNNLVPVLLDWLYNNSTIWLKRKRNVYESHKNIPVRKWTKSHYGRV